MPVIYGLRAVGPGALVRGFASKDCRTRGHLVPAAWSESGSEPAAPVETTYPETRTRSGQGSSLREVLDAGAVRRTQSAGLDLFGLGS